MPKTTFSRRAAFRALTVLPRWCRLTVLPISGALALALVGCGGGGGGTSNKTLVGTLLDFHKAPIAQARVVYDADTSVAQTTTTGPTGAYKFVLPLSAITGSDTLTFYDSVGDLVDIESITLQRSTAAVSITTVAPPTPPVALTPKPGTH